MASWWVLTEQEQQRAHDYVESAALRVMEIERRLGNENSITAALGAQLMSRPVVCPNATISFRYRNFLEQSEEPVTGADGGIVVEFNLPHGDTFQKAILFQAKRLPGLGRSPTELVMKSSEAKRLGRQADDMLEWTEDAIGLFYANGQMYAVDAQALAEMSDSELRTPLAGPRLISFATYLGKWVLRCTRGDLDEEFIARADTERGFLLHRLNVRVEVGHAPLLRDDRGDPATPLPAPRWATKLRQRR